MNLMTENMSSGPLSNKSGIFPCFCFNRNKLKDGLLVHSQIKTKMTLKIKTFNIDLLSKKKFGESKSSMMLFNLQMCFVKFGIYQLSTFLKYCILNLGHLMDAGENRHFDAFYHSHDEKYLKLSRVCVSLQ